MIEQSDFQMKIRLKAFSNYVRARRLLKLNQSLRRENFVKFFQNRVDEAEKEFPDFRETYDQVEKGK